MKSLVVTVLLVPIAAHAGPSQYVQADVMVGGAAPVVGPNLMTAVEGGYHVSPELWGHAALAAGPASDDQGSGKNVQARAGLEVRGCGRRDIVCLIAGADLGIQHGTWTSHDEMQHENVTAMVLVPRAGFDIGGDSLRARLGLEIDEAVFGRRTSSFAADAEVTGTIGIELVAGVAYQW